MEQKVNLRLWLIGIAVFLLVIAVSLLIEQGGVTFGIVDHQAARTGAMVDEIQTQWREAGVRNIAIAAVLADLAWIWIYALGSFVAGRGFATKRDGLLRAIGFVICAAAVAFGITDYTETVLQLIQLLRDAGDDSMAGIAAFMQPIKSAAFVVTLVGVILAFALDRLFQRRTTSDKRSA